MCDRMEIIWNEIVDGTKDFIHRAGFKKVVLGLSGGIDSSVVACIAATAAPSRSFSPTRRATIAVVDIASPMATEYTITIRASVRPTVAVAADPSLATKKTSKATSKKTSTKTAQAAP